jgi:hypothetical protein
MERPGEVTGSGSQVGDGPAAGVPQLRLLPSAIRAPLTVTPQDSLRHAETQMLLNDYSQLPVMSGERTVDGLISWKSIGRHTWSGKPDQVSLIAWTQKCGCWQATCRC